MESFAAEHADFAEVVAEADMPLSPALQRGILSSEHGAAIAYHLAKHPDEAAQIAGMDPVDQLRALGRLEARFEKTPEPVKPKATTKAPKPPSPVTGTSAAVPRIDGDIEFAEYEKLRRAEENKRAA